MEKDRDLPATTESLPIALVRAREVLMGPIREMLGESGVTEQQWRILRVLEEGGPMDARALAHGAAISAPSLSRMLPALEGRGLVSRTGDPTDRRRQVVRVEAGGRELIEANRARARELSAANRARLGEEKYQNLIAILGEISAWTDDR